MEGSDSAGARQPHLDFRFGVSDFGIGGIARAAQVLAPRVALSSQFKSIAFIEYFNLAMASIIYKHYVIAINRY